MRFGAAYYPEYQPYERLDRDIALMQKAGFTWVRVGESTWSSWEPADGRFELGWMEKVLDALDTAGIGVVLGTPTYAIPPWLWRKHPEIMAVRIGGEPIPYGGRQNVDFTHPAYRFHAGRVIRAVIGHFADHPAVIGYQVDNETGIELLHNRGVLELFTDRLREAHGSVERLNELWGLTYWSHRLETWHDLWPPDGNTSPGYALAWRRFQADLVTEFLAWQAQIVREYARPDQFVTTCIAGGHGMSATDREAIGRVVDVTAENVYYPTQDGLRVASAEDAQISPAWNAPPRAALSAPEWMGDTDGGPWTLFLSADLANSSTRDGFLVTETNAGPIGGPHTNFPPYDGQLRLAAYSLIARGARAIEYWHWHTLHYGHEMYWGGVLGHDLEPSRVFAEIARIGAELQELGTTLAGLVPEHDSGLLYSVDSKWSFEFQPPLALPGSRVPDVRSYERIVNAFYRMLFDAGLDVSIKHPAQLTTSRDMPPILVVPALYVAADELLARLTDYARSGGHLVLTFRSGYADEHGRARWQRAPGPLREAVGASYQEFSTLTAPVAVLAAPGARLQVPPRAAATAWADGLVLEDAEPLLQYDHPHLVRFPAACTRPHGAGRVTYIGMLPDQALARALGEWIAGVSGLNLNGPSHPETVRVSKARTAAGDRLWFVGNWSWHEASIPAPADVLDLHSGTELPAGGPLALGAWDVRVLKCLPGEDLQTPRATQVLRMGERNEYHG